MYGGRQRRPLLFELIIRLYDFELDLTPLWAYVLSILKVTERLDKMKIKEDIMEALSTVLHCNEPDELIVVSETPDEEQDYQNSLLKGVIKLISSLPVSSNISAIKSRCPHTQASDNSKTVLCIALWHYLHEHGEDMKKWHKKKCLCTTSTGKRTAR